MKRIFAGLIAVAMLGMASCSHDIPDDTAPYVPIQADYMKIGFDDRSEAVISSLPDVTMYTIFYVYINRPEDYTKIKSLKIIRFWQEGISC